jgi:uncharacterized protein
MMKYLLLAALLLVAYMIWRGGRISDKSKRGGPTEPGARPQEMIACAACGLHLPRSEAVFGSNGRPYCSQDHRLASGA